MAPTRRDVFWVQVAVKTKSPAFLASAVTRARNAAMVSVARFYATLFHSFTLSLFFTRCRDSLPDALHKLLFRIRPTNQPGLPDCSDASDEKNCSVDICRAEHGSYLCGNGRCIRAAWLCDRSNDCTFLTTSISGGAHFELNVLILSQVATRPTKSIA